jgi:hypothetical protein
MVVGEGEWRMQDSTLPGLGLAFLLAAFVVMAQEERSGQGIHLLVGSGATPRRRSARVPARAADSVVDGATVVACRSSRCRIFWSKGDHLLISSQAVVAKMGGWPAAVQSLRLPRPRGAGGEGAAVPSSQVVASPAVAAPDLCIG